MLVQHVKLALAELDQGFAELAVHLGVDQSRIVVGSMPLARTYILPAAINALTAERPEVRLQVIDGPYGDLLHGLRHGEIDVLIGALRDPVPIEDVVQETLFTDPLAVVARAFHPLSRRPAVTPADLAACRWVVPRPGTPTRDRFDALFAEHGLPAPTGLIEASSLQLIRGAAAGQRHADADLAAPDPARARPRPAGAAAGRPARRRAPHRPDPAARLASDGDAGTLPRLPARGRAGCPLTGLAQAHGGRASNTK
ncbi:LysR substrate-binding domain-containing protein [Azospirillum doebereinerae]|uniref:LysR substrate-binding domain-containing protein n=1 Tax=Azospirillum doebereinerae TaxID=92933 RepID=UPI00384FDD57